MNKLIIILVGINVILIGLYSFITNTNNEAAVLIQNHSQEIIDTLSSTINKIEIDLQKIKTMKELTKKYSILKNQSTDIDTIQKLFRQPIVIDEFNPSSRHYEPQIYTRIQNINRFFVDDKFARILALQYEYHLFCQNYYSYIYRDNGFVLSRYFIFEKNNRIYLGSSAYPNYVKIDGKWFGNIRSVKTVPSRIQISDSGYDVVDCDIIMRK